jgi:hypothetical protein
MRTINCYIPIKVRVTGRPSDSQLEELGEALARCLTEQLTFAERTIAAHLGRPSHAGTRTVVRVPFDPAWYDPVASVYSLPSYDEGTRKAVRVQSPAAGQTDPGKQAANREVRLWADFAAAFNRVFGSVLHAFEERAEGEPVPSAREGRPGKPSGQELSPKRLQALFTKTQRNKLLEFFATQEIPEHLFDGDDRGTTTAQQRLLLSAHILANGTYRRGSFEQKVHARFCWHWVQIVHHYAGVTPATGGMAKGVMGSFDPLGGVVLGTGKVEGIYEDLRRALPIERFDELRPGDWIWIYNGYGSAGRHSLMFSRWTSGDKVLVEDTDQPPEALAAGAQPPASEPPEPAATASDVEVRYREAICFHQPSPAKGGREEEGVRLGDRFYIPVSGKRICPIIHVSRVSREAHPAATPEELLRPLKPRRTAKLSPQNLRFLRAKERELRAPVDLPRLRQWIHNQNVKRLSEPPLRGRLTDGQQKLLRQASEQVCQGEDLETLLRLNQRLVELVTYAEILERNEAKARAGLEEEQAREARELAMIDPRLGLIRIGIGELERRKSELDPGPEIRELQGKLADLWKKMKRLPRGPKRDELQGQRRVLQERVAALRAEQHELRGELGEIQSGLRALRRQARPLERQRQLVVRAAEQRMLPHEYVHPGSLSGYKPGRATGLAALNPPPDWANLVEEP